jgi:predicted acyl esterase
MPGNYIPTSFPCIRGFLNSFEQNLGATISRLISMVAYSDHLMDISTWKKHSPYFIKAGPPEAKKYPSFNPRSVETPEGLLIEYDVTVPMRDGVKMYVDIYRLANQPSTTKIPAVIAWTPVSFLLNLFANVASMANIIPTPLKLFRLIQASMYLD